MTSKHTRRTALAVLAASVTAPVLAASAESCSDGIVKEKSAYPFAETIARLKADIAEKGIMFFLEVNQSGLGKEAGIELQPSTLLIFGNPPLGTQFLTARQEAGLDWPVRLLVYQDDSGQVWTAYSDFQWIAKRHNITNREEQFQMASMVIASITSQVKAAGL